MAKSSAAARRAGQQMAAVTAGPSLDAEMAEVRRAAAPRAASGAMASIRAASEPSEDDGVPSPGGSMSQRRKDPKTPCLRRGGCNCQRITQSYHMRIKRGIIIIIGFCVYDQV